MAAGISLSEGQDGSGTPLVKAAGSRAEFDGSGKDRIEAPEVRVQPKLEAQERRLQSPDEARLAFREMKGRAPEHVRWRSAKLILCMDKSITRMRSDAFSTDPAEGASCVTDLAELWRTEWPSRNVFLGRMHRKSLRLTNLKSSPRLQQRYVKLLGAPPDDTDDKSNITAESSAQTTSEAVVGLLNKYTGEVVETDQLLATWRLIEVKSGAPSSTSLCGPQFRCQDCGQVLGDNCTKDLTEAYLSGEARGIIWSDAQQAAWAYWCDMWVFMPDWKEQRFRVAVPIMQPDSVSSRWEWRRQCSATTFGSTAADPRRALHGSPDLLLGSHAAHRRCEAPEDSWDSSPLEHPPPSRSLRPMLINPFF